MILVQPQGEMSRKIREELREPDADAIDRDVAKIREWLERQPHLPNDMDDGRLRTFLRGCKFSLEKVKKKLDMYYTMRNAIPEFFTDRDLTRPELSKVLDVCQMCTLPGLTANGRRVTLLKADEKNVVFNASDVPSAMKIMFMLGDIRLYEELVGVGGDVVVLDASVATPQHFAKFTPNLVKKFLVCTQEAYPVKLKEIHVINVSPFVDTVVNFVKPFLKEKIRERIYFHADVSGLYKYVPKTMLPIEYGGELESIKVLNEQWRQRLIEYGPWFKEQEKSKANESLRPGSPKTSDDLFGMDDDGRLRTFLRGCKFSLEKVKKKLDMYYTMRNAIPEFFTDRDLTRPELSKVLDVCQMCTLPGLTANGRRVTLLKADEKNVVFNASDVPSAMKIMFMLGDIRLYEELVGVGGDVVVLDASVATPQHFAKFTPNLVKKFLVCTQEAYPVKLKEIHVINVSPFVDTVVNFVKPFLKEKIRERIYFHADVSGLYKYVPKTMLPIEYGGELESIKVLNEQWRQRLIEYGPWFKEQEKSKANESLRPGSPKTSDDLFGMDGTFRKLTID